MTQNSTKIKIQIHYKSWMNIHMNELHNIDIHDNIGHRVSLTNVNIRHHLPIDGIHP
jgi:hypothetical protein